MQPILITVVQFALRPSSHQILGMSYRVVKVNVIRLYYSSGLRLGRQAKALAECFIFAIKIKRYR